MDLFHFSHDPSIERFTPHVPVTNPSQPPLVWAIDAEHAPLYWFPRDCPRVTAWPRDETEQEPFRAAFCTVARRVHAIELDWLPILESTVLYRYRFEPSAFRPWIEASGQWVSETAVEPLDVERVDDLVGCHVDAGIELRAVPNLWPLRDLATAGPWDFSIVRFQRAAPRPHQPSPVGHAGRMGKLIPPVVVADAMGGTEQPVIEIDRELHLRPWHASDVGAVLEAFSDPDIQHWHFRRFDTEAEAAEWIQGCNADWQSGRRASWAIIDTASARVVGRVAITTELEDGYGEVSYWVLPAHRAKGIATRACVAATRWAHGLGLHRIALQHSTRNDASRSVAVKAGFVEEGVRRGANLHDDGWHDMRLYSHLATDPTS